MLKIYGLPISVHTRKVIVAAIEKDLPFENEPVVPFHPPARFRSPATVTCCCAIRR